MIRAYPDRSSVLPGRTLTLHVSTDKPLFRVEFFRQGQTLDKKATSAWMPGQDVADKPVDQDWEWPSYDFEIGEDWPSGAYVAVLTEGDEGATASPRQTCLPRTGAMQGLSSLSEVPHPGPRPPFFTSCRHRPSTHITSPEVPVSTRILPNRRCPLDTR